jgi:2-oxoglutarate ferredoxin oxidoreductase subunit delta
MPKLTFCEDRCKGCELCVSACPRNLLSLAAYINRSGYHPAIVTDAAQCNGCALCARMCPDVVIEVEKEG